MTNPFFDDWTAPFGAPPLDRIKPEHFAPAYDRALAEHTAEIAGIVSDPAPPHVPHDGHVRGPYPRGGRPTERHGRCLGGMGNPLTLYWSHDQSLL